MSVVESPKKYKPHTWVTKEEDTDCGIEKTFPENVCLEWTEVQLESHKGDTVEEKKIKSEINIDRLCFVLFGFVSTANLEDYKSDLHGR